MSKRISNTHIKLFRELGKRFKAIRSKRDISQKQIGDMGSIRIRSYLYYEAGAPYTMHTFFKICEMLGVHPSDILKGLTFSKSRKR